jgi:hypothetical protein
MGSIGDRQDGNGLDGQQWGDNCIEMDRQDIISLDGQHRG